MMLTFGIPVGGIGMHVSPSGQSAFDWQNCQPAHAPIVHCALRRAPVGVQHIWPSEQFCGPVHANPPLPTGQLSWQARTSVTEPPSRVPSKQQTSSGALQVAVPQVTPTTDPSEGDELKTSAESDVIESSAPRASMDASVVESLLASATGAASAGGPASAIGLQLPSWQVLPGAHVTPQYPQLLGSVCALTHEFAHAVSSFGQTGEGHGMPQVTSRQSQAPDTLA
jgi:hypothetical protein